MHKQCMQCKRIAAVQDIITIQIQSCHISFFHFFSLYHNQELIVNTALQITDPVAALPGVLAGI